MRDMFRGVKQFPVAELGISQIYLNEEKLAKIQNWLNPADLANFEPLPVYHFGNGKLTLTDGHSRAFIAYTMGIETVPIVYDTDEIITSETGQLLYKNDIIWCERFNLHSVCDLKDRILSDAMYRDLWIGRCDRAYNLLTKTTQQQRKTWQALRPDFYLYGASEQLETLFFENAKGKPFPIPNPDK